jgi:CDP-diacylglycerol--glycerol-3-phosphate 3-phosphatidyltransferase/cardiolipin synthase
MSYRARDLLLVPGLLSLARVPLGVLFPFVASRPMAALSVLLVSGATDVADGWWARRFNQATPTGAAVDPITDKLFVASVVTTLVVTGKLAPLGVLLLATREIGELPLVLWFAASHASRRRRAEQPLANLPGKMATLLQFVTVASALFASWYTPGLLLATGVVGLLAAASYWVREIARFRADRAGQGDPG